MKKVLFFCLCSFLSAQLLAQPFQKKQITNFDYDSRGATFPVNVTMGIPSLANPPLFFEAHDGMSSNIMMMIYDQYADSFYYPVPVTSNIFKNINSAAGFKEWYPNLKINLVWQTNENGNWDIALRTLTDSGWSIKKFIANSPEDEINPKIIFERGFYPWNQFDIEILYEKGNSIYLYQKAGSLINNEIVFQVNGTELYKQPTGIYVRPHFFGGGPSPGLYVAATSQTNDSTSKIVYRIKSSIDSIWSPIMVAFDSVYSDNPIFFQVRDNPKLSFETKTDGIKRILIFEWIHQLGQNWKARRLIDQATVHTSQFVNFNYFDIPSLSDELSIELKPYFMYEMPHSFKYVSNDSVFVAVSARPYFDYIFFNTQVRNSKIAVGYMGRALTGNAISYFVWEDSSNGRINLFGTKRLEVFVGIKDKIVMNNFILFQNYPNPFNPKTMLKFELLSREFVTLKVFDVLGNEVAALVKEEKDAGEYKLEFDGSNLASGIYVYRLSVGSNHVSKKMILLK